jgi:hypothetical protein
MSGGRVRIALFALTLVALATGPAAVANHSATDQVSVGPINGNGSQPAGFGGSSPDGTRVFFVTSEQLVSADTDNSQDVYERSGGDTTLISTGPTGGNAEIDASFSGVSADGTRAFFTTSESLVPGDTDAGCVDPVDLTTRACEDVYERSGGTTTLISTGPNGGSGAFDAFFEGSSTDGSHVFFTTNESLVPGDTDSGCTDPPDSTPRPCQDVYERSGGTTVQASTGTSGNGSFDAFFEGSSADGSRVFFTSAERLVSSDTDSSVDVYQRSGGGTTLISTGAIGGNGAFDASYAGSSSDGSRVFIETQEPLASGDADLGLDIYERSGGTTTLVSTGPAGGNGAFDAGVSTVSSDGGRVFFITYERLVSADTDSSLDIYERSGGTTTLVSSGPAGGNGAFDVFYRGATPDGTHLYFTTAEKLAAGDTDSSQDIYEHTDGVTAQVSVGEVNGNGPYSTAFRGVSDDGARVFFTTREKLVSADSDPAPGSCVSSTCSQDVYERFGGTTYLISLGPTLDNGNKNALYNGASRDGRRVFYSTLKQQVASDTDSAQDVYQSSVPQTGYPRPKGATPVRVSLAPAFQACTAPNRTHGPPLAMQSCAPPSQASQQLTVGTPDANGMSAKSVGFVNLATTVGDPATSADEADVKITASITDVRARQDLSDYTGELQLRLRLRITDRLNGSSPIDPATVSDLDFPVTIGCGATADATIGSTCAVATTADAVLPGTVIESKRSIWEMSQVQVFDGGPDAVASTYPNTLFAVQALFVP